MSKGVIGIDPGKSGGIAYIRGDEVEVYKIPPLESDIAGILANLSQKASFCYIEKVGAMPGQGVTSMFSFGRSYGFLRGCLISFRIPFDEVPPRTWQASLGCLSKGDKNVTKSKAQQLFPQIKVTHALADALLIAYYGKKNLYLS